MMSNIPKMGQWHQPLLLGVPGGYEIKYPHKIVRRPPSQGSLAGCQASASGRGRQWGLRCGNPPRRWVVESAKMWPSNQQAASGSGIYVDIHCVYVCIYIYIYVVHAYTYVIICIDDTCMYISVYIYIYIHMEVYGWEVDSELEISGQVSGPIGLQVGKVQLDLASWSFGLKKCGQIALKASNKNDETMNIHGCFLEMIYFYMTFR